MIHTVNTDLSSQRLYIKLKSLISRNQSNFGPDFWPVSIVDNSPKPFIGWEDDICYDNLSLILDRFDGVHAQP